MMPGYGITYWAKYVFADLSMVSGTYGTSTRVDLDQFSICRTGYFKCLKHLGIEVKATNPYKKQLEGIALCFGLTSRVYWV